MSDFQKILDSMAAWRKFGVADHIRTRTPEQCAWDSAILCAAEFVRRMQEGDETLSGQIQKLTTLVLVEKGGEHGTE